MATVQTSDKQILHDGNPDGVALTSGSTARFAISGVPIARRSSPAQTTIQPQDAGQIVTYQQTVTPATVAQLTAAEKTMTIGTTAGNGVLTTDFVAAINKPAAFQAGLGIHGGRVSAANTVAAVFSNTTGATLTPTNQNYNVVIVRGISTISQTLSPASVAAGKTSEQVFTLAPTTVAAATAIINSAGQVVGFNVTAAGAGYQVPPLVTLTNASGDITGRGATAVAILSGGTLAGITLTHMGEGYTAAPVVTFSGGFNLQLGMVAMVNKAVQDAGLFIGNVRIPANGQIAITFANPTAAAVTPTASDTYTILGLNTLPAISDVVNYGVTDAFTTVASITTAEQSVTINGVLSTDIAIGIQKPTTQALGIAGQRVSAANTLYVAWVNPTAGSLTPTAEILGVTMIQQSPQHPLLVQQVYLTPSSVAANTTAEQTFTILGLNWVNSSPATVVVNKPSHTQGITLGGARISAANTLSLTFENITSAAIVPPAEVYTIGAFQAVGPGTANWVANRIRLSDNSLLNFSNEVQNTLAVTSYIKGS